jgi:hypothetical protein
MKSVPIYRAVMLALEARRLELGISMATVDDMAGTQDGYYAKMIYPDTPSGRQASWPTVDLVVEALFGTEFDLRLIGADGPMPATASIDKGQSHKYLEYRHWRHAKHFTDLAKLGAAKRNANLTPYQRTTLARRAAKARWKNGKG